MKLIILILVISLFLGGCATRSHLNNYTNHTLPQTKKIDLDFIPQEKNLCGPTVLKMVTQKYLPEIPFEKYKQLTFRKNVAGTFKSDMLSSIRRLGLAPYRVPTLEIMLNEVSQDRPIIVFQNLGLSWWTIWHYSLLVGYDIPQNIVYLHSGKNAYEEMDFSLFVRTWHRGEDWSYEILPLNIIPNHVTTEEALDNAMVFENIKEFNSAKVIYTAIAKKWPNRFEPHLGLANILYEQKNYNGAIQEMHLALKINPQHPALLFNLANLYFEKGSKKKAEQYKRKAIEATPIHQRKDYSKKFTF